VNRLAPDWRRLAGWGLLTLILLLSLATARAQQAVDVAAGAQWQGYDQVPLRVNIWHDHADDEPYRPGEAVRIHFETNRDGYVVVYRIDTAGRVTILWPRSHLDDGFVFGHHTYHLPTAGARRIRAGDEVGVEYVEAIFSEYPFDLRELDIDFHEEREAKRHDYYVAGDPFLAMNEVNYAVTGLDDAQDYVVTNYVSYSVGRQVDHPRYLCTQCHDPDTVHDPYRDHCTVEIHYDYGWANDWYVRFGYYPVYYYPTYYYVDPWTWTPWINFWYRPWYAWPDFGFYSWGFSFYLWDTSPYYRGDVWVRYKHGDRRYRPLAKVRAYREPRRVDRLSVPRSLVVTKQPESRLIEAMRLKRPVVDREGSVRTKGTRKAAYRNVPPTRRRPVDLGERRRPTRQPGLRVPGRGGEYPPSVGSGAVRGRAAPQGERQQPRLRGNEQRRLRPADRPRAEKPAGTESHRRSLKPVTPRGGREGERPPVRDRSRTLKPRPVKPRSGSEGSNRSGVGRSRVRDRRDDGTRQRPATSPAKRPVVKPKREPVKGHGSGIGRPAARPTPPPTRSRQQTPQRKPPVRRDDDGRRE